MIRRGLYINNIKAETANILIWLSDLFLKYNLPKPSRLNMITERNTGAEKPVIKAKHQRHALINMN